MDRSEKIAAWMGAIIGVSLGLFVLVYLPMKSNYEECGKVTLCNTQPTTIEN
jgi:hypothetical protein